jgi:IclR family acetate operon transcriptional repressor
MPGPDARTGAASRNGVSRVLRIVEYLLREPEARSQREIGAALGIPRSTLSDLLSDLRRLGMVAAVAGRYVPGPALVSLGNRVTVSHGLDGLARPALEYLADVTGETCVLSVEVHGEYLVVPILEVEGSQPIRYSGRLGKALPLHHTGAGQVFLAFSGRRAHDLPPPAGDVRPPFAADRLEHELEAVRRNGYALQIGTRDGFWAMAAPVRDVTGWPVGAVSVVGPTERLREGQDKLASLLVDTVSRIGPVGATAPPQRAPVPRAGGRPR